MSAGTQQPKSCRLRRWQKVLLLPRNMTAPFDTILRKPRCRMSHDSLNSITTTQERDIMAQLMSRLEDKTAQTAMREMGKRLSSALSKQDFACLARFTFHTSCSWSLNSAAPVLCSKVLDLVSKSLFVLPISVPDFAVLSHLPTVYGAPVHVLPWPWLPRFALGIPPMRTE